MPSCSSGCCSRRTSQGRDLGVRPPRRAALRPIVGRGAREGPADRIRRGDECAHQPHAGHAARCSNGRRRCSPTRGGPAPHPPAACLFADIGWRRHPDDRALGAFSQVLTSPFAGAGHRARAVIAAAVFYRYSGDDDFPREMALGGLLGDEDAMLARRSGLRRGWVSRCRHRPRASCRTINSADAHPRASRDSPPPGHDRGRAGPETAGRSRLDPGRKSEIVIG